jgi:hypothetical protein
MSEIQDLKNHVTAMSSKMNHIVDMVRQSFTVNDKMNELLSIMHNIGLTNQNENNNIFGCVLPDLVRRISAVEKLIKDDKEFFGTGDHVEFFLGKGKKKTKFHMIIKEKGVSIYTNTGSFFTELLE